MRFIEFLAERTWEVPRTPHQARKLTKLLQAPLPAKSARATLNNLVGDDNLFGSIRHAFERNPDEDVRPLIIDKLKEWVPLATEDQRTLASQSGEAALQMNWNISWDPLAIKLLRRLTRMRI